MLKHKNIMSVIIFLTTALTLGACSHLNTQNYKNHHSSNEARDTNKINKKNSPALYSGKDQAVRLISKNKHYAVSLYHNESSLPLNVIHSWVIHVENLNGNPIDNAKLYIFGGMPMHKHDFPTKPRIKKQLGNGDYLIEGIKFNMPGHWQMRFNIKHKSIRDRVLFDIHLQ